MPSRPSARLQASPWLAAYAEGGQFVLEDFFSKRRFVADRPEWLRVLAASVRPRSRASILRHAERSLGLGREDARGILDALVGAGLLVPEDGPAAEADRRTRAWIGHGWSVARDYAMAIRDYPFLDYDAPDARDLDEGRMRAYLEEDPVPPVTKEYPEAPRVVLPRDFSALDAHDLGDLLLEELHDEPRIAGPMPTRTLAAALLFAFGRTGTVEFPLQGEFLLKTSPSGGARHPVEAYVLALDCEVPAGLYHYSVRDHALERLQDAWSAGDVRDLLYEAARAPQFPVKAILLLSAVFPRSMWRYREPRSYRVVLHDVGHVLETLKIACRALGVCTYFGDGFRDRALEERVGLGGGERVLKLAALG